MGNSKKKEPEFGGHCAFAVSIGKSEIIGDRSCTLEKDGKLYVFNNVVAKFLFQIIPGRLSRANENWRKTS